MAAKVWYGLASKVSVHMAMSETSPGVDATASPVTGWVVSTGATNHAELFAQVERAASTFTGTTVPDGSIDTTNGDCFRTENTHSGDFASANWTVQTAWIAVTNGGAQDGRMRCRLLRSANADGSGATEITAAQQQGGLVTNLATSAQQLSTATFNPGAFTVTNEYIFVQVAWERTGAGGMTTSDVNLRVGTTATVVTSADFTAAADPQTATPATAALTTTTFAPTVTASDHQTATPGVASLTTTTFAPSVTVGVNVVPTTAALSLASFEPTVSTTAHQTATPDVAALTLTAFAPTVTASDHKTATPGLATLALATFAPTVTATANALATPSTASLVLTAFAPTVTATGDDLADVLGAASARWARHVAHLQALIEVKKHRDLSQSEKEEEAFLLLMLGLISVAELMFLIQ